MRCGYSWPLCGEVMRRDGSKGRSGILEERGASRRAMSMLLENVASSAACVWFNCAAALLETPSAPHCCIRVRNELLVCLELLDFALRLHFQDA
jgi:hypothetical protein